MSKRYQNLSYTRKNAKKIFNLDQTSLKTSSEKDKNGYESSSIRKKLEEKFRDRYIRALELNDLVSYVGNKETPFLSLYRYKEAFSHQLVDMILDNFSDEELKVFDPFNGMGTTIFSSSVNEIESFGIDRLPLSPFITNAISDSVLVEMEDVWEAFSNLKKNLNNYSPATIADDVAIIKKVLPQDQLSLLVKWKSSIDSISNPKVKNTLKLLFLSILIDCSYAKNAGQFLRIDKSKNLGDPKKLLKQKLEKLEVSKKVGLPTDNYSYFEKNNATLGDARDIGTDIPISNPNMVITSPPYPNRYDYTRCYSLELAFEFVKSNEELINLRHQLLRSHIESKINSNEKKNIHPAVKEVVDELENKDLNNNKIPDLLIGYFHDMDKSLKEISNVMAHKSRIFLVVDNVRYEGEVIPTDTILADMAKNYGFELKKLLITRYKGNSSQQMKRYGRVPVRESILWLERGN